VIIQDWLEMVNGGVNWEEKFSFYKIDCVILEKDRPIIEKLINNQWKTIFIDDNSIILTNPKFDFNQNLD
jgi:hypothetical protein